MFFLDKLKKATTIHDVAKLLGFKTSALSYLLYVKTESSKYHQFEIPKSSGGVRSINAPTADLKFLQKRLSILLQDCIEEINVEKKIKTSLSHGFKRKYSIITNSEKHRNKRYVFNIDLEDFFGTINFGRVRGFFIENRNFRLNTKVATILAQIICYQNALPQGSPCSPVMSNLIAHILDIQLARLAYKTGCTYSRYADDITFSTNKKDFPKKIARKMGGDGHEWICGTYLKKVINKNGFLVNESKTRMQYKDSRQSVTGLIVNSRINTPVEYWRTTRAMVDNLFKKGIAYKKISLHDSDGKQITENKEITFNQLNGMLAFIDQVDFYNKEKAKLELRELSSRERLYRDFLFYKNFYSPQLPSLICEGKTDNVYIKEAIKSLSLNYPSLISNKKLSVQFFNYTKISDRLCWLAGGTADLSKFVSNYVSDCKKFTAQKFKNPVIIIIDNDKGSSPIYSAIKQKSHEKDKKIDGEEPFYYLGKNLYVVPIPKINNKDTMIEDYFKDDILNTQLNDKTFSKSNSFNPKTQYGKHIFATEVVKRHSSTIDFSEFGVILDRIVLSINDYKTKA